MRSCCWWHGYNVQFTWQKNAYQSHSGTLGSLLYIDTHTAHLQDLYTFLHSYRDFSGSPLKLKKQDQKSGHEIIQAKKNDPKNPLD